jgi:hypothetical protein
MRPREIEISIDELVLHGVSPADRLQVGTAVEHELARLVAERGVPASVLDRPDRDHVDGGSFSRRDAGAGSFGRAVARAVYEGLSR